MTMSRHELEQRMDEAAWPFWKKLQWLEEAGLLAQHLRNAGRVPPPDWVLEAQRTRKNPVPQDGGAENRP